jgi:hypothetical protein
MGPAVKLYQLQLVIIAALVLAAFAVAGLGTPRRIKEMCREAAHKDAIQRQVCRDFSAL